MADVVLETFPTGMTSPPKSDEGEYLSPLIHLILGLKQKRGGPELHEDTPENGRTQYRKTALAIRAKYKVGNVEDFSLNVEGREIAVRHYLPHASNAIPAVLVYFHGGGYVIGELDTHDDICRLICRNTGLQVLSVDYRLAPEHPFPAGIEDADHVVQWVQQNAEKFSIEKSSVLVGGDSAGATIAAATANNFSKTEPLLAQLLFYPGTDKSRVWDSYEKFGYKYFLNIADRDWFYAHYMDNSETLAEDPNISPLKFDFTSSATPGVIVTAGFDVLRDEGRVYADKLKTSKAQINHFHFGNLTHGFVNLVSVHGASKKAAIKASKAIQKIVVDGLN